MNGKCRVIISRPQGRDGTDVCIQITDELSQVQFATVYMTHEQFSVALGSSVGHGEFDLRGAHLVGMTVEHKTEVVPFSHGEDKAEALASFEVDGWKGDRPDLGNMHKRAGDGFKVMFRRHVPLGSEGAS